MRYKVVPEPLPDLDALAEAQRAVPLVPETVEDCCTRLRDRCDLGSRDRARELLTFLEALELATETDRGYRRTQGDVDRARLARQLRDRVFGAREVLETLAASGDPVGVDEAFAAIRDEVPRWERHQSDDWEGAWRDRVGRLLDWAVLFGLARETDGGYEPT
jgi:hypothetical protein